jgi:uncharacterized protein YicC (UPF0701 family)
MRNVVQLEQYYRSEEVAEELDIPTSTLRTYTTYFRNAGYVFQKDRLDMLYTRGDMILFQQLKKLHEDGYGTTQQCINRVLGYTRNVGKEETNKSTILQTQIDALNEKVNMLRTYVDRTIHERDEKLMYVMREMLKEKNKNKYSWWKFWR